LFYRPGGRLSLTELAAARLDGLVVEVGEGYMPADTVEGASARAAGVAALIPPRTAACGSTAAWIHGAGDAPPTIHHVRRTAATRMRVQVSARVLYHERRAAPEEVRVIHGVGVTTPLATAVDLLFAAALGDERDERWLRALLLTRPEIVAPLRDRVQEMPRRPGRRCAVGILASLPDVDAAHRAGTS